MAIVSILGLIFTLLGIAGSAYALLSLFLADRFVRKPAPKASSFPPVTVLKPLHGAEPGLAWCLETFFLQQYRGDLQLVFGVHDNNDAAVAIVEQLRARHPRVNAVLVSDTRRHGSNPKISNIIGMASAVRNDVLVLSDSDIAVAPNYLEKVVAALEGENTGAVTCLYAGWAAAGFASRLSAMGVSYQFLPNVITGVSLGLTQPCFGSTIAIKRAVLDSIGGFAAFASVLADDYEIGRAVRAKGRRVFIPNFAVRHACGEATLGAWFRHELRWMRTIRTVDPAGHWGSIVTQAIPLALVGAILLGFPAFALGGLAAAVVARAALKWQIDRQFGVVGGPLWLLPLRDMLSFGVFLMSLFGGAVVWQDERLHVVGDGALLNRVRQ
jgi:ceramide glucosyltransferase